MAATLADDTKRGGAAALALRAVSLAVAGAASLTLLLYPYALGRELGPVEHTGLPLLMLGASGAFTFGVGYRPENRFARLLLGPAAAWALMLAGAALLTLG